MTLPPRLVSRLVSPITVRTFYCDTQVYVHKDNASSLPPQQYNPLTPTTPALALGWRNEHETYLTMIRPHHPPLLPNGLLQLIPRPSVLAPLLPFPHPLHIPSAPRSLYPRTRQPTHLASSGHWLRSSSRDQLASESIYLFDSSSWTLGRIVH